MWRKLWQISRKKCDVLLSVNFRRLKTDWSSNSQIAVWFTFCTTLELYQHRWMDVLQPWQIHRHKIPSFSVHFRCFTTPRQKSSEKAPRAQKPLTPFRDWLKLITNKTFTKWEVCTFRIGASRGGASFDRFRERNVTFFSLSTSGVWKQVDARIHKKPFGSRFVPLLSSSDIGEWTSHDLRKYIDTKFQVFQSIFVVLRHLNKKALKKHLACDNHSHRSGIGLNLWQAKVLRSGRSAHSELARVDAAQVMTDFEKELWRSSICQLPASENRLTLEFTDSGLVHVLYHSWALSTSVNGRPTTFANTSTQNSKFFSPFSLFYDTSTKKL